MLFIASVCTGAPGGVWKKRIDVDLKGDRQSARLSTTASSAPLLLSTVSLETTGGAVEATRAVSQLPEAQNHQVTLPAVRNDTYLEATVTVVADEPSTAATREEDGDASAPLLRWRTLARPPGQRLEAYAGRREMRPPADFDRFWETACRQLAAVPLDAAVIRVPDRDTTTGLLHRVELQSVHDTRIVCWYYVPRDVCSSAGTTLRRCPAILIAPGYGAEQPPMDRTDAGYITLSVNPRNHGPSKAYWKAPVDHLIYNIAEPEAYYYRSAALDCLRAAQFLYARSEVDPGRVAAEGGSQGGLLALAVAALEPRIACVCTNVTAFTDYPDGMALASTGHHVQFRTLLADSDTSTAAKIRLSLAYTDGANLASRIKCPVQINMGALDSVCPYVCGIVLANRLPKETARELFIHPEAAHQVISPMRENNRRWYGKWLK